MRKLFSTLTFSIGYKIFWHFRKITLKIADLSVDTFLTNIRTDVALQKSPRNTKNVSGSISILMQVMFFNKYYLACNNA